MRDEQDPIPLKEAALPTLHSSLPTPLTWFAVLLIGTVGCLPIVGQPVQVDDPLFLGVAKQILATPHSPFGGQPAWHDGDWFRENANPPLWSYLLAATAALFGWNETAFQGLQCLCNLALAFGIFALARRICLRPLFWTAACLLSPFLLPGRNLMADTLLLALWCWAFELFLQAALDGKRGRAVGAGVSASAALLTKYTGGLLVPLFFILCWRWKTPRPWAWLLPAVVFAAWCGHNQLVYGRIHFFHSLGGGGGVDHFERVRVLLRIAGALVLWTPVWWIAAWTLGGWRRPLLLIAPLAAGAAAYAEHADLAGRFQQSGVNMNAATGAQFALFLASGVLLLAAFIGLQRGLNESANVDKTRAASFFWLVAAAAFNLSATSSIAFGAVRHLLVVFVPMLLLGGGAFDRLSVGRPGLRLFAWLTLLAGAGLGGLLAHGDRLAAAAGVRAAAEVRQRSSAGERIFVSGDPALRYYVEPAGGTWWRGDADAVPVGGTVVLLYSRNLAQIHHPVLANQSTLVGRTSLDSWNPFRTQSALASFYAANVTTLPWVIETSPQARTPRGGSIHDELLIYRRVR
jgi:4-amino-4-deoxy-L-arabinose transferase-like glycosyltransferase